MARGEEGKLRRRLNRKQQHKDQTEQMLEGNTHDFGPVEDDDDDDDDDNAADGTPEFPLPPGMAKAEKEGKSHKSKQRAVHPSSLPNGKREGIKTTPLILLVVLMGTTLLPAFLYAGDWIGRFAQRNNLLGAVGYRLGVGSVPKQRVMSFYEKHDPTKIPEVPKILAKHYGDYPLLIKKLERKYQDYGYFVGWEEDEAPLRLALEQLQMTYRDYVLTNWNKYAPQALKTAARNIRYNMTFLHKRLHKIWKRKVWPWLEPIFGVPKGSAAQKREDARKARERLVKQGGKKTRRRSSEFRDDVDDHDAD
jgi:hypothetical protein